MVSIVYICQSQSPNSSHPSPFPLGIHMFVLYVCISISALHCWCEYKLRQPLWRTVWRFLKKPKIELPCDPATPLLGIYPEKTIIQKDTCTPMFIAALFTIARSWKQAKCPSTDKWIKKLWYLYTVEYYSGIKRNKIGSFVDTWMDLETVIQSAVSQKEENKYRILLHIYGT